MPPGETTKFISSTRHPFFATLSPVSELSIPEFLVPPFLGVLGLLVGSFLNVVIARVPAGESIVSPPSHCPKCNHAIRWYENIPVLSWVFLRGRCSGCKAPISARYVLVELLTGVLFLLCFVRFQVTWPLAMALLMVSFLIPLVFTDAEHWILPDQLTWPGIVLGILMRIPLGASQVWNGVLGAVAGFLLLRAIEWFGWLAFRKEAMGGGDKFLMALLGAFLGWRPMLGLILLSSLQGAVWGVSMLAIFGRARPTLSPAGQSEKEVGSNAEVSQENEEVLTFSPAVFQRGLSMSRRLVLVPYTVLLQDIPDPPAPVEGSDAEPEWIPEKGSMPFGPWLALAGLEILLLGPTLLALTEGSVLHAMLQVMIGE